MVADLRSAFRVAACAALVGCAAPTKSARDVACHAGEQAWMHETLYLGTARAHGGSVDSAQWTQFEHDVLLAQFPNGFTVLDANGHWRDSAGRDFDEPVRTLVIDHADDAAANAAIDRVIAEYRQRFDQEAVLRERGTVCVSFNDKR